MGDTLDYEHPAQSTGHDYCEYGQPVIDENMGAASTLAKAVRDAPLV
jgi:hypothetical protein